MPIVTEFGQGGARDFRRRFGAVSHWSAPRSRRSSPVRSRWGSRRNRSRECSVHLTWGSRC